MVISRYRTILIGLGLVTVFLLSYFTVRWTTAPGHPGGDPNGRVLNTMKGVERVVPSSATNISIRASDAQWLPACHEFSNSRPGWDKAMVYVKFSDSNREDVVDRQIGSALEKDGWSSAPIRVTRGQGLVPHWVRAVSGAQPIDAFAYETPAGSNSWFLTASWQPPGPAYQECP